MTDTTPVSPGRGTASTSVAIEAHGPVRVLRLDRPDKLNALDADGWGDLLDAVGALRGTDVRALVIAGAGRGFCAGMDVNSLGGERPARPILAGLVHPVVLSVLQLGVPVVSVVDGVAAGAGIGLALLADYRIGTQRTRFVAGFAQQGLVPDAGSGLFLSRTVGAGLAGDFFLGGRRFGADESLQHGLIDELVPEDEAEARGIEVAVAWSTPRTAVVRHTLELIRGVRIEEVAAYLQREALAQDRLTVGRVGDM